MRVIILFIMLVGGTFLYLQIDDLANHNKDVEEQVTAIPFGSGSTPNQAQEVAVYSLSENIKAAVTEEGDLLLIYRDINKKQAVLESEATFPITHLKFSEDAHWLLSTDEAGHTKLWNIDSKKSVAQMKRLSKLGYPKFFETFSGVDVEQKYLIFHLEDESELKFNYQKDRIGTTSQPVL